MSVVLPGEGELVLGHDIGVTRLGPGRRAEHLTFGERLDPSAEGVRVTDITDDREGGLWLATGPLGLLHVAAGGERSWFPRRRPELDQPFRMPEDSVCYALHVDRPGEVIAGMHDTLLRVKRDGTAEPMYREILPPRLLIRRLARDSRGRLLMATGFRGVWREDRGGIGRLPSPPGAAESCYGFASWRGRTLVCGSDGLFEIIEDEVVPFRDEGLDLEGDRIYAALGASDGTLLLGTQRGVVCWDGARATRDTVEDGLGGLEVNRAALVEDAEHRILVGTNGGLSVRVGPPHARRRPPRLVFATARSGAKEIDVEQPSVTVSGGDALSFTLRTVTFDSRASLRIRYRLEGAEAEWTELPGSHDGGIHFTGLAPGRYRLVAELRGLDGSWGDRIASPEITLSAPVWSRPWFLTIAGGAALGVVALALAFARTRRRNALLARELAEGARALREREHSFADAFQRHAVPQAILAGPGPEIRDLNRAARHLFRELGLDPEGSPLTAMIVGATDPFERAAERCRREGSVERVHLILRGPLGRKTLELLLSPLVTADGTDLQVVLLDATRRHRLESELREAYKELAVGRTTRAFAHDFNNLLLVLGGNAEVAMDRADREGRPADRELEEICGAVERGRQLVRRLAGLGEEGRRRRTRFAPDESLAAATDEILRQLAGQAEVVCDIRRGAPSAFVDGDERSFRAALVELVDNAREAMPRGGRITITSGLTSEAPRRYFVEVRDEGEGFAPESLARVAEPFFSTRPAESGRGLGLAEVRRFATRSGGRLDVANREDGPGARIRIELPLASDATPVPRIAPDAGAREVLAIGPDDSQRRQLAEVLAGAGLRLATAADGPDAMRIFSHLEHRIAAVVLFPGLDGIESRELTRILRGERADLDVVPFEAIADPERLASSVERWRRPRSRLV
ncbi:MAG: ATP-binding protein [Planctomycetota bacterium]